MYAKYLKEPKDQLLVEKRKKARLKNLNDPTAFIECGNSTDDIYDNIEDCNQNRMI